MPKKKLIFIFLYPLFQVYSSEENIHWKNFVPVDVLNKLRNFDDEFNPSSVSLFYKEEEENDFYEIFKNNDDFEKREGIEEVNKIKNLKSNEINWLHIEIGYLKDINTIDNITKCEILIYNIKNNLSTYFRRMPAIVNFKVIDCNTSKTTDMSWMFISCKNLKKVNLSKLDTSRVTNMFGLFYNCFNLTEVILNGLDTREVTDMSCMFEDCSKLTKIDLGKLYTNKISEMSCMFFNCLNLKEIKLGEILNTDKLIEMYRIFYKCNNLWKVDMSVINSIENKNNIKNLLNALKKNDKKLKVITKEDETEMGKNKILVVTCDKLQDSIKKIANEKDNAKEEIGEIKIKHCGCTIF